MKESYFYINEIKLNEGKFACDSVEGKWRIFNINENTYVINALFTICSFIYKFKEQMAENGSASILNFILNFISIKELDFSLFFIFSFNLF